MSEINLPEIPKGIEYEEYISSYLQSTGYYIERNIIHREVEEILELDIIATDYKNNTDYAFPKLIEIKSGDWGFSDVFKIRGWLDYTNIDNGFLITQKTRNHFDYYKGKADELNIELLLNNDLKNTHKNLASILKSKKPNEIDLEIWRFSYWTERNLLKILNSKKKSIKDKKLYKVIEDYHFTVNSSIFFTNNLLDRIEKLYDIFKKHPRLTLKCAHELNGEDFNKDYEDKIPQEIFKKTYFACEFTDLIFSTYVEHLSRLVILKKCVDYILGIKSGIITENDRYITIFKFKILKETFLPQSTREALEQIENDKYFHKYPVFWQWFLFAFGGFIVDEFKDKDFKLLAEKTGIPVEEIPNAFKAYDILFPVQNGWLRKNSYSKITQIHMFPLLFSGIGANLRRLYYTKTEKFEDLNMKNNYAYNDLIKWNNLTYNLLKKKI